MRTFLFALAFALACFDAAAAAPQPQPLAPGGAIAAAKARARPLANVVASPSIMQTSAVRMSDGTVALVCDQKPNPHPRPVTINRPAPVPQQ